ncbi:MAG: hypothetical protein SGJ11_07195 [Phycisphaerae bacterium]|nr:hypothetical protein [Phycisphaerae bacterium]
MSMNWIAKAAGTVCSAAVLIGVASLIEPEWGAAAQMDDIHRLATAVDSVRAVVGLHRHSDGVRTTDDGWPLAISPTWFPGGTLPIHPATGEPVSVEIVDAGPDQIAPSDKVFHPGQPDARTLWYNRTNGAVCARIPAAAATLERFNQTNRLSCTRLEQTER